MKETHRFAIFGVLLVAVAFMLTLPVNSTYILVPFAIASFLILLPRDMLRNVKIIIWVFFIIVSLALMGINLNPSGFSVVAVGKNSTVYNIAAGEIIYKINDVPVTMASFEQPYHGTIKFETSKGTKYENLNGTLGMDVSEVASSNLKFGLDLKGGVRAVIDPNTTDKTVIDQTITTLQTRINVYGLRETAFRPIYYENKGFVEISMAGGSKEELRNLMENQGVFEAKINFMLRTIGGAGTLRLDKAYTFTASNNTLLINDITVVPGETFEIGKIEIKLESIEADRINVTASVIRGSDVKTVYFDPQRSRIETVQGGYRWSFAVQLSQDAAQHFAWVTNNLDIVPAQSSLSAPISFYLDTNLVDSLSISSTLKGKSETEISIAGSSPTKEVAIKDRARLQSILKSGALPTAVTVVQLEAISPTLGAGFLTNAMLAGLAAILGIIVIVSVRYRRPKIVLPMLAISISEVLIILGFATMINWTIDLPAIAGIIATIGTGIDSQVIIIDQALRGEEKALTLKEKMKRAFFVVFGSGGTVIAAMIPIAMILYAFRGFAITTTIGVLVGILIARPAFGVIVQKIMRE
jgi:preprotein translocase subunit SecD